MLIIKYVAQHMLRNMAEADYPNLYGHIIHKNDSQTKPDLMVVIPDLQLHPDQCQSCQSLGEGSHHSQPQEAPIWTYYT